MSGIDNVNHPSHYTGASIECFDAIAAAMSGVDVAPISCFAWGNCLKYLWRWPRKGGVEDLKKARWYLDKLIELEGAHAPR
jgi:hypothetical protein